MQEENCFRELTDHIKTLLEIRSPDVSILIEQMYKEIQSLENIVNQGIPDIQIEECAVNLWNWGVTMRVENTITEKELAMGPDKRCFFLQMAIKTGKGWIDAGNPDISSEFLGIALSSLEKLYALLTQRSTEETDINMHKAHVERDIFKVLTYQARAAVSQKNFELASHLIDRCKDMLERQPNETAYLSILCYNFGIETYEKKIYDQSSFWLSQSYEIGKTNKQYSPGHEMQAKILRLLATVYMKWDCKMYIDKALNTVQLANEESSHPAGLFLKMKILLHCSLPDEVINMAAIDMLHHELPLDIYLNTVKLFMEKNRDCVGFDFLKMICNQFEQSPDIGKVLILEIEFLLKQGKEFLAQQKVEDLIKGHNTGKQLPQEILSHLHLILWDCAAKTFERKNYAEALQWFNYSLSFYDADNSDPNLAKLLRNQASCYLCLNDLLKAKEAAIAAEELEKGNIFTHFILYKIAMKENDVFQATTAITAMGNMAAQTDTQNTLLEETCSATDLLSLAAQIALEVNQKKVAIKALECVAQCCEDTDQMFTSLRCLVRLSLEDGFSGDDQEVAQNLISYLTTAYKKLEDPLIWKERHEQRITEANWFRKIAWNLAVRFEDSPIMMQDCFLLSYKLSLSCPCDRTVMVSQKSCLIMAASVDLQMAKNATCHSEQVQLLIRSLENINLCREIWIILQSTGGFSTDPTEVILLLYEFEVRAKLNDPGLEAVLESVWNLPSLDVKTLESIASLSMEAPAYYPSICKKVLRAALTLHQKQESLDVQRISKCLHSLIKLSLPERYMELENYDLEEAWRYYQEALSIVSTSENYPEAETLWLMTRAWNTGILQYGGGKYSEAARWCSLAHSFLSYLGSLKSNYESKMMAIYSDIQEKSGRKEALLKD